MRLIALLALLPCLLSSPTPQPEANAEPAAYNPFPPPPESYSPVGSRGLNEPIYSPARLQSRALLENAGRARLEVGLAVHSHGLGGHGSSKAKRGKGESKRGTIRTVRKRAKQCVVATPSVSASASASSASAISSATTSSTTYLGTGGNANPHSSSVTPSPVPSSASSAVAPSSSASPSKALSSINPVAPSSSATHAVSSSSSVSPAAASSSSTTTHAASSSSTTTHAASSVSPSPSPSPSPSATHSPSVSLAAPSSSSTTTHDASSASSLKVSSSSTSSSKTATTTSSAKPTASAVTVDRYGNGPFSGWATWFDVGLNACGTYDTPGMPVVAASAELFDNWPGYNGLNPNNNPICGLHAAITWGGKTLTVEITDRCPGCAVRSLDLSKGAFEYFAGLDVGLLGMDDYTGNITWSWVEGTGRLPTLSYTD